MHEALDNTEPVILVADDDEEIRSLIADQLATERFRVIQAGSVHAIRQRLVETPADLMVLDLNLPDGDGLALCREFRSAGDAMAIIMVTARDSPIDRVLGLELGADDYLTKPFEPRELLARIRNLLRRQRASPSMRPRNARFALFGGWRLDLVQRRLVSPGERLVMLSSSEFRLLDRFIDAPNRALSRDQLAPDNRITAGYDRTIDLQISRLRQKLSSNGYGQDLILTVRNEGYVFASDVAFE